MEHLRAAAVQFNHKPGDKAYNLARIRTFAAEAHEQGVDLLVFPEMCITGYWHVRNLSREAIETLSEPVPDGDSTQFLLYFIERDLTLSFILHDPSDHFMFLNALDLDPRTVFR